MPIVIVPADPNWPQAFAGIKAALTPALPAGAVVHHIGSTAVPGLAAKDIIDLQVTVASLTQIDTTALAAAGFNLRAPTSDHCPPGMTLPPSDLCKRLFGTNQPHAAHVHFRELGRFNQRYPLLCRDYLRAHSPAAAAYAVIKHNLAARFPDDIEAYYAIKDPVFDLIMVGAAAWAERIAWTAPPGD